MDYFNRSLNKGIFPSKFKFSSITPILKSGSPFPSSVLNFRPFSIQFHTAKIFESLILKEIQLIEMVCCKALTILGFINRLARNFKLDSIFNYYIVLKSDLY